MSLNYHLHDDHGKVDHSHDDDHSANHHHTHRHGLDPNEARYASSRALRFAVMITFGFAVVEALGGWWTGSLALLSDAGHMLTDSSSLLLALLMAYVGQRPADARHSFGHGRAEVIAAFINSLFMFGVIIFIAVEAVGRVLNPQPVNGSGVMLIATAGLAVNVLAAWVLSHGAHTLNSRAALLHVIGDMLGSVAAIAAGAIIHFTGWTPADPILSVAVAALILASTWRLLRQSLLVLMEGVPEHLDYNAIGQALAAIPGVGSVHDLHVWYMSSERIALSAHLGIDTPQDWPRVLAAAQRMLSHRFHIDHVTLQAEWSLSPPPGRQVPVQIRTSDELP